MFAFSARLREEQITAISQAIILQTNILRVESPGAFSVFWVILPLGNKILIEPNP